MWPSGSKETIEPSNHDGWGGKWIGGSVFVRSGRKLGLRWPSAVEIARYVA